ADSAGPPERGVTVVSSSPATTWALVTTRPGAATQPEPSTPRPHAVPSTLVTESPAASTPGAEAIAGSGGPTLACGPRTGGVGSTRRSTLSSGPEGGSTSLRERRTRES